MINQNTQKLIGFYLQNWTREVLSVLQYSVESIGLQARGRYSTT